jgi:DNA-binding response OmpR family regulator
MLCNMSMPTPGEAQRIVVADDDDLLSEVLVRALEAGGYEAVTAPKGVLDPHLVTGANLVILDAHIPGVDFASTLQSLRATPVGVLVLSGEPSPPPGVASAEYLAKPVHLHILLAAVGRLVTEKAG